MASLFAALAALQQQVSSATTGLLSHSPDTMGVPINVEVGLYWPSARVLQSNVKKIDPSTGNLTAIVTIYDRGIAAESTRWSPGVVVAANIVPATLTATINGVLIVGLSPDPIIYALTSIDIIFGGPVTPGDAAAIILSDQLGNNNAVVAIAGASDTPDTIAIQGAQLISADPVMSTWVTAVATGPTLRLTSLLPANLLSLIVNIGNGGTYTYEIARRKRHFQIVVWARTPDDRQTVTEPIDEMIATLEYNFGLTFPDGTMGRLTYAGDVLHDEATLSDTMRRDFMVCLDYPVTSTDAVYALLAPIMRNTNF